MPAEGSTRAVGLVLSQPPWPGLCPHMKERATSWCLDSASGNLTIPKTDKVSLSRRGKRWVVFVTHGKIQTLRRKLEFWKNLICHHKPDNFPMLKAFLRRLGVMNQWDF